ncbi:hypothetical protein G7K_6567-t1 [Saitoella complicata NRRL Y-17804]|uniref:Uncharacterized protein n=1 Tax=Saitoella complicata (strain BCRC 22490 / CBS 7301 / JCM 7358 / NBRC 10748 / NRRL Y-17804) TaxID=698492 RepID=A0A0E9NRK0_SAICN|nr:hypothetical protein G7K_6567-t1 [Saitoella complicata NRRL Y-17804]
MVSSAYFSTSGVCHSLRTALAVRYGTHAPTGIVRHHVLSPRWRQADVRKLLKLAERYSYYKKSIGLRRPVLFIPSYAEVKRLT